MIFNCKIINHSTSIKARTVYLKLTVKNSIINCRISHLTPTILIE